MTHLCATAPRFDWYSASFDCPDSPERVFSDLIDERPRICRPQNGYERAYELRRDGRTVARVMNGGHHEWPHVIASGYDALDVSELLRHYSIWHAVSRVDACIDVVAAGAYESFERTLLEALPPSVTRTKYTQTRHGQSASTLYLGSRKSETFARVYEKGKESPEDYPPETVRLEVQARPNGPGRKQWAAKATPHEVMSLPRWSATLLKLVNFERLKVPKRPARKADLDRSIDAMVFQYGKRLRELRAFHGGDIDAWANDLIARIWIAGTDGYGGGTRDH